MCHAPDRTRHLVVLLAAFALGACASPPHTARPSPFDGATARGARVAEAALPPLRVLRELESGTVLRLLPMRREGTRTRETDAIDGEVVDALLREALRQSARFDLAADVEDGPAPFALLPILDAATGQLALALLDESGATAPQPLAAVTLSQAGLGDALDVLAWTTRRTLGDPAGDAPRRCVDALSSSAECIRSTERALAQLAQGRILGAELLVDRARRSDPGAPLAWLAEANLALARGETREATRVAESALRLLAARLTPTTQHRLARTLLLARAQADPPNAARHDGQLQELGETFATERPFDPHARWTIALAHNHRGEFAAARDVLAPLAARWPRVPYVAYHHAFALLGLGDCRAALAALDAGARELPEELALLPRAFALFGVGANQELDELLTRLATRDPDGSAWRHELLRMRASLAILERRDPDAVRLLLEDLQWLHARPSVLVGRLDDIAEAGECLVRLGAAAELAPRLDALLALPSRNRALSSVLTYLGGLVCVGLADHVGAELAITTLERSQEELWATRLRAARAHGLGHIEEEARELATAIQLADAQLDRAEFARVLDALGRRDDAATMREDAKRRRLTIRLRGGLEHPLTSPVRALSHRDA